MKRITKVLFPAAILLIPLCLVFAYGFIEPHTAAGHFTFHTFYLVPPSRPAFLQFYARTLRSTEGGYLPAGIDHFLALRLWEPDSREWRGIIAFYLAQGSGRWGEACGELHDSLKPRLVRHLLSSISADDPGTQCQKLVFIEYLRRDGNLHKGGFTQGSTGHWDEQHRRIIYNQDKINQAIAAFQTWFSTSHDWPTLERLDPLQSTGMQIAGTPMKSP